MNTKKLINTFLYDRKYRSWHIFIVFLLLNLIQGIFTPLLNDESYYWLYAQKPALGYYDHPPLIAWLIGAGTFILKGEAGVRLFAILAGSFTPFFLYKIIEKESSASVNLKLFLLLTFSSVFVNLYAFLAIPDTLLLFFTVLFFWQYRRFLHAPTQLNSILLGLVCALLLYSKYHGILVIGFTLISNLKLLTQKSFYRVVFTAILLFIPHIIWQINNDFQTLNFHLFEKGNEFKLKNILSYTGEQLLLTGPVFLLLFTLLQKTHNIFLHSIKMVSIGVLIFFFVSSFRGMVNAYWTLVAWPGMLVLSYFFIEKMKRRKKPVLALFTLGIFLVMVMRINFLLNIYPIPHFNNRNPRLMAEKLAEHIKGHAVFHNTFIDASAYSFYSKKPAFAVNNTQYKKTQYNFFHKGEKKIQGKAVSFISLNQLSPKSRLLSIPKGKTYYLTPIDSFISYQTSLRVKSTLPGKMVPGEKLVLPVEVEINAEEVSHNSHKPVNFYLLFTFYDKESGRWQSTYRHYEKLPDTFDSLEVRVPMQEGNYKCHFSISPDTSIVIRTYNSRVWFVNCSN